MDAKVDQEEETANKSHIYELFNIIASQTSSATVAILTLHQGSDEKNMEAMQRAFDLLKFYYVNPMPWAYGAEVRSL